MKHPFGLTNLFLVSLGLFLVEYPLFYAYCKEWINTFSAYLLQGIALLIPLSMTFVAYVRKQDIRYPFLLFLSMLAGGPFGPLFFLLFAAAYLICSHFSTPIHVWFEELFPMKPSTDFEKILERVRSHWDDYNEPGEVSSFFDLLEFGSTEQKLVVLDAIARDFKAEYALILQRALNDPANEVRIQAGAVLQNIELKFDQQLALLLEAPAEPSRNLKLAELYDSFALLVLSDKQRIRDTQESALYYYQEYLKTDPGHPMAQLAVGRILYHLGDMPRFIAWIDQYRGQFKTFPGIFQAWHLEALHKLHRYEELTRWIKEYE